ncbi:MAG: protein kinase [Gemmataceae bacterium]
MRNSSKVADGRGAARLIAVQAARALKHAHNRNVLHRDLKPAHLMIAADGTLKILGFGLARVIPAATNTPITPLASASFNPPEVANGKPLTRRSDLPSAVLYTLLTGRPPFAASTLVELMHKQCYTLPERPAMLVPDLPPELDEFVCVLLDKNPARRPATAAAVLDELERIRGKLERKGEQIEWPAKLTPDTAEVSALPVLLGADEREAEGEPRSRPLMSRPLVVLPLLVLVVGALVVAFAWPDKTATELYTEARPAGMDNPSDWDTAIEKYLDPLSRISGAVCSRKSRPRRRRRRIDGNCGGPWPKAPGSSRIRMPRRRIFAGCDSHRPAIRRRPGEPGKPWSRSLGQWSRNRGGWNSRIGLKALERPENRGRSCPARSTALTAAIEAARRSDPAETATNFRLLEELFRDDPTALN